MEYIVVYRKNMFEKLLIYKLLLLIIIVNFSGMCNIGKYIKYEIKMLYVLLIFDVFFFMCYIVFNIYVCISVFDNNLFCIILC